MGRTTHVSRPSDGCAASQQHQLVRVADNIDARDLSAVGFHHGDQIQPASANTGTRVLEKMRTTSGDVQDCRPDGSNHCQSDRRCAVPNLWASWTRGRDSML